MRRRRTIQAIGSASIAIVVACAPAADGTATPEHRAAFALANAQLDSAYRRGDAAGAGALMTDSVIVSAEGLADLNGRTSVEHLLTQFFAAGTVEAFTLQTAEVTVIANRAFERGTFAWRSGPRGGPMTVRSGRYAIQRLRGSDGTWRMHRYLENSLPAATSDGVARYEQPGR